DVELIVDPEAVVRIKHAGKELNEARLKMARVPEGADLIDNPISAAPGFRIENVFVLAGVPPIAHAMFAAAEPLLRRGAAIHARGVDVLLKEGDFALVLERIQQAHPQVEIGSYPFARNGRHGASLVVRGTDELLVEKVRNEIMAAMAELGGAPTPQ